MKTKIDLITGFLGAGKTTFLKCYLEYLKSLQDSAILLEWQFLFYCAIMQNKGEAKTLQ